jgi:hypothetical protein
MYQIKDQFWGPIDVKKNHKFKEKRRVNSWIFSARGESAFG